MLTSLYMKQLCITRHFHLERGQARKMAQLGGSFIKKQIIKRYNLRAHEPCLPSVRNKISNICPPFFQQIRLTSARHFIVFQSSILVRDKVTFGTSVLAITNSCLGKASMFLFLLQILLPVMVRLKDCNVFPLKSSLGGRW